ncbi:hypothetical protein C1H46_010952 [Malus baccata]|uniref:FAD/NAD(P)-binding domain-containing protein n=1 Tax=Malus baccata TaxID=106549 RepID=A0A540MXE7_MALBA|nr:hypothetical protein C1H46_010952 [Malus baccata]
MSESRVGVPESLVIFVVDNGCAERWRGRLGWLGVGFLSEFWFQLEAISATINGEGMVVCSSWGWPVRKGLLREVRESLISLFPPLLEQTPPQLATPPPFQLSSAQIVITSDHALKLAFVPEWIAIVGSGYIGLEFSDVYTALGSEVTFIEALDQLMPGFDPEIGKLAHRVLINPRKIDYQTGVFASKITPAKDGKPVTIELIDAKTKEPKETLEHATEHIGEVFKRVKKI